jgi:hypothetical protein
MLAMTISGFLSSRCSVRRGGLGNWRARQARLSRNGVVEHIQPDALELELLNLQEPGAPYEKKP